MDKALTMANNTAEVVSEVVDSAPDQRLNLDIERQQIREEFNIQRAKMKELFLQKEEELKRMMSEKQQLETQLLGMSEQLQEMELLNNNQKSEIESLQYLVHETVEASSRECHNEVHRLQNRCVELQQQINMLNKQASSSQDLSLAPSVLVQAVTKSIARKLGADPNLQGNLEDSMKKAQEDTELLKSLVVPLEEEINVLKDKLRDTDTQLQQALQANNKTKQTRSGDGKDEDVKCDMCANYEAQLVAEQAKCKEATEKAHKAELVLKMATEELEKASAIQTETVSAWQTERTLTTDQLTALTERVRGAERTLGETRDAAARAQARALHDVTQLTVDRETLQENINSLQMENDRLVGKYCKRASELQSEDINFPDNVADLQEYALRLREELIVAALGREDALAAEESLRAELCDQRARHEMQIQRFTQLEELYNRLKSEMDSLETERQQMKSIGDQLRSTNNKLLEALEEKRKSEQQVLELRSRVTSLQHDLDNNESVQQDFVRLSQELQVQLERIREAETEVRWQHDDDVEECNGCHQPFSGTRRKAHCRHCGRIYCSACLSHMVPSGPRKTPSKVCSVCHTLLDRHAAPYFSKLPQTPD